MAGEPDNAGNPNAPAPAPAAEQRDQPAPPPAPRRHRKRRFVLRALLVIALLLILAVVAIQVVLMTALPRSLVIGAIQQQLGLRMEAATLRAGWFGNTSLTDVKIGLPLADTSVVTVPALRVKHTWLPLLLIGRPVDVKSIEIDGPTLYVSQDAAGRWNLQEVVDLVTRAGGKQQGEESAAASTPADPPKLPAVAINNATIHVTDNAGRKVAVERLNVSGKPDAVAPALLWHYDVGVEGRFQVKGAVVPGRNWRHEVRVTVVDVAPYVKPWMADFPGVTLDASWSGAVQASGGVAGRLDVGKLQYTGLSARGAMGVGVEGGTFSASPERLTIDTGQAAAPQVVLVGGKLAFADGAIAAEKLTVETSGGQAQVDARYDLAARGGTLAAQWQDLVLPGGTGGAGAKASRHGGRLDLTLATRLGNRPDVRGTLVTRGSLTDVRAWSGNLQIEATGADFRNLDWTLTAPTLALQGKQRVALDGLTIAVQQREGDITLQSIRLPQGRRLDGAGRYNLQTQLWSLTLDGQGWPLPYVWEDTLAFRVDVSGTPQQANLNEVTFRAAEVALTVKGKYLYQDPKPVRVDVALVHEPPEAKAAVAGLPPPLRSPREREVALVRGRLRGAAKVIGTVAPLDLDIVGALNGDDVWFRDREIGKLAMNVEGKVDPEAAMLYRPKGEPPIEILKGKWDLAATYYLEKEEATVKLSVAALPIAEIGQVMKRDDLAGTVDGNWTLRLTNPAVQAGGLTVGGKVTALNVRGPGFAADRVTAVTTFERGQFSIDPLEMWQGPEGYATVKVSADVSEMRRLEVTDLRVTKWPVPPTAPEPTTRPAEVLTAVAPATQPATQPADQPFVVTADVTAKRIDIDLGDAKNADPEQRKQRVTSNSVLLGATVKMGPTEVGRVDVIAGLLGRVIDVRDVRGDLLGAELYGQSVIDFDHPLLMTADFYVMDLRADRVAAIAPGARAVTGSFNLHARLHPVHGPKALEPTQLDVDLESNGGSYAGAELGDARLRAFLNLDPYFGLLRVVLEDTTQPPMPPVGGTGPDGGPANAGSAATTGPSGNDADKTNATAGRTRDQIVGQAEQVAIDCAAERPTIPDVNTMHAAGGVLRFWGRVVRHEDVAKIEGATSISTHVRLAFKCLSLDQLRRIGNPKADEMPGKLNGSVVLFGSTGISKPPVRDETPIGQKPVTADAATTQAAPVKAAPVPTETSSEQPTLVKRMLDNLYGDGAVEIREADLGNLDLISGLYNLMNLGQGPRGPTGYGSATYRIEGGALNLTSLHYFNRGVEARAVLRVDDLPSIPDSPISGHAFGSPRPLKDTKIPLLDQVLPDIDAVLSAVVQDAVSVKISGTVRDYKVEPVVFGSIGRELQGLISGDIQAELKGSAGR